MEMAKFNIFIIVLVLYSVTAAPSDIQLEDIAKITKAEARSDAKPGTLLDESIDTAQTQGQRQKRWYNYYGFPPVNPSFFNRDDSFYNAQDGLRDPLTLIHRRLQEITNSFRQPPLPQLPPQAPPFPQIPAFFPVIYIPQVGCACTPGDTTQGAENRPSTPQTNNNQNKTENPGVANRWPEMDDERQNWGIVMNNSNNNANDENNTEDDGDGSRPISFEPIRPIRPMSRPPPAVEHGSVEGNINSINDATTTTTTTPQKQDQPRLQPPSNCDSAILRCCLLPEVTYDCFAIQGCPDISSYGYPCDNGVIARVIDRFLRFYNQKNG